MKIQEAYVDITSWRNFVPILKTCLDEENTKKYGKRQKRIESISHVPQVCETVLKNIVLSSMIDAHNPKNVARARPGKNN